MTDIGCPAGRRVLIVSEKPALAKAQYEAWKGLYPDDEVTFFYVPAVGRLSLSISRDLSLSGVPRIEEPRWVENDFADGFPRIKDAGLASDLREAAGSSDLVVCGTDPDHAGAFNFWNAMRHSGLEVDRQIRWWKFTYLGKEGLQTGILEGRTVMDPEFQAWRRAGEARRFFDYNYAINALPCFSRVFREMAAPLKLNFISKFALQLLLKMVRDNICLRENDVIRMMNRWPGSGKYENQELGSPMSRAQIVEDLKAAGLLRSVFVLDTDGSDGGFELQPSRLALDIVSRLHKGMEDPDLPARLDAWGESWPESRPQMERYIRTVFGRQKRFLQCGRPS